MVFYCIESTELLLEHRILHSLLNVPAAVELVMTKFTDHINWRFISQINQRHLKSSPKITKIFQWYDHFNILCITITGRSSCNFYLESEWLRICYNIVTWKVFNYRVLFDPYSVQMQSKSPYSVWKRENTNQKKLRIWTLHAVYDLECLCYTAMNFLLFA